MKRLMVLMVFALFALATCGGNGQDVTMETAEATETQSEIPSTGATTSTSEFFPFREITEIEGKSFDEAIAEAIDTRRNAYLRGQFFSSAYHILQIDENSTEVIAFVLATHGWYNRATELEMISGGGITHGVVKLTRINGLYVVKEYREYGIKQILYSEDGRFPDNIIENALSDLDYHHDRLKNEKQAKVIGHFGL